MRREVGWRVAYLRCFSAFAWVIFFGLAFCFSDTPWVDESACGVEFSVHCARLVFLL